MRRRELMATLGGAAVAWPLLGRTQQINQMRRVGVLMLLAAEDAVAKARIVTFRQSLRQLGWIDGNNLQIDYGWSTGDSDQVRKDAVDLVALAPDVLLATGSPTRGGVATGDAHRADRVCAGLRSGRCRLCR